MMTILLTVVVAHMDSFGGAYFTHEKAAKVENIFLEVRCVFKRTIFKSVIEAMRPNESNSIFIDFYQVMWFNNVLQKAISGLDRT